MAERVGFEPTNELPRCWFSRPVLSTTQPPLLIEKRNKLILLLRKNNNNLIYFSNTSLNKLFMITNKMAKFIIKLIFLAFTNFSNAETEDEKALQISTDAYNYDKGFGDFTSDSKMTLRNKQGEETIRNFRGKTLEVDGDGDKTLFIFDSPKDVKGTATLTFTHKLDPDDQWLYLPALKRVKRITSDNRSGSFVGSEFAYEDLGSQELEKYKDRKYFRKEACPNNNELECHVISRVPTEKSSGYKYQVLWLDDTAAHKVWKIDYFDRKGSHLKTLFFDDYKIFDYQTFNSNDELKDTNIAATLLKIQERKTSKEKELRVQFVYLGKL